MKNFIQTIKNIWSIEELRNRILFTLALIFIYRLGSYIVLPGVIPAALAAQAAKQSSNDLLGLINIFTGGAFNNASIMALGIMPYITSSIIVQLLGFAIPYFQRLQTKEGESGRKKLNQITRFLTVAITLVQGSAYLTYVYSLKAVDPNIARFAFFFSNIIILTTGTIFAMWLGERITDKGIGNGVSLLIMIGIIARMPEALIFEFTSQLQNKGLFIFVAEMIGLFLVILGVIAVIQAVRRIPVQYAKRMVGRTAGASTLGNRDYIPLKLNGAGVMPIIFAQAIMFLPATVLQFAFGNDSAPTGIIRSLSDITSIPYNIIYFILVVLFTYVYTALLVNPTNYAEYLKRNNAFIPGVKPGESTAEFIDSITSRITLPGAVFLGLLAITPAFAKLVGVNQAFAVFFGGTTVLIMVGVALDTLQQIESYLLMRKYDGLVKEGKLKGRATQSGLQQIGQSY